MYYSNIYFNINTRLLEFRNMADFDIVTGDHAEKTEPINAITRKQQRKQILDSLPKQARDVLSFNIRKFNGRSTIEAEKWLKDIEDWMMMNDLNLVGIFDLLLCEEASILWKEYKNSSITDDQARGWFNETFTKKKSIIDKLSDLSNVMQNHDERFATFEIRVRKLVDEIFDCGISREDMVGFIVSNRVRNERLRDSMSTKANMTREEMRNLAKVFEEREGSETQVRTEEVHAVERKTYANIAHGKPKQWNQQVPQAKSSVYQSRKPETIYEKRSERNERQNYEKITPVVGQYNDRFSTERRAPPLVSMKHIARKVYNRCCGLPDPVEERLKPGQCFCCGQSDHMRFECPLKDRCLICGKEGHSFRSCHLLTNSSRRIERRVYCIHEEDDARSEQLIEPIMHNIDNSKNQEDPVAYISSVGSRQ